jgi:hypothetical protein
MSALDLQMSQDEIVRSDKTGSLGITLGTLGRKKCSWSTKMSLAPNGAAGTAPDMNPFLEAIMGAAPTITAPAVGPPIVAGSVLYALGDASPSLVIWDFNTPATVTQRALMGAVASKAKFDLGADEPAVEFSGPGLTVCESDNFATADAITKAGLTAFPTEPASPVTNGIAPPGFTGSISLDGNTFNTYRTGSIVIDVERELPMDGFNSYYGLTPAAGLRNVSTDWSMYDDDSANLQTLKAAAAAGTPVTLTFQIGTVAGSKWMFTLNNVLLPKPKYDYSGKRRTISFTGARAHDTTIGAKDAITITVS